ncbi:hypothetical protein D9756_002316 [Leucocoprinus leucothites]|uniref:Uncharacterized protein n=1 Tax=Leucocoprinus leucothites TaxID=201217 RepID=A0A8H5GCC3_9AGAR|nr:hypothetical protein D9756_002316 [Leucoagaricus leucothites]
MSPHRLATIRRYKISNDVLILILENMDPDTLYLTSKVFRRVYVLAMEFFPLRYKYELALTGMKSGAISSRHGPPFPARFNLLLSYRTDWPVIKWGHEQKAQLSLLGNVDITDGFIHYVAAHGVELMELPSSRTGKPPSQTRHVRIPTAPRVECVALDSTQTLIVTGHVLASPNQIDVLLKIRDMWTFNKHKESVSDHYSFFASPAPGTALPSIRVAICGDKLLVRLEYEGTNSRTEQLLINWKTLHAARLAKQDILFLDQDHILVVEKTNDGPSLFVYNVRNVQQPVPKRQFQLPDAWKNSVINFHKNDAPRTDIPGNSTALFYSDPARRLLMLSARPSAHSKVVNWMMFPERLLGSPCLRGASVAWNDWCQYVIVRNTASTHLVGEPAIVGTRVLYLDQDPSGAKMRINAINFAPHSDAAETSQALWDFVGKYTPLVPTEAKREISPVGRDGSKLQDLRATEDNIVLLYERTNGHMPIKILTFGAPSGSSSPR